MRNTLKPYGSLDFRKINTAAMAASYAILHRLLPDGRVRAGEFVARNPRRADARPGSFQINLRSGLWSDFATGDKGGDLISYVAYVENIKQTEAAALIARMLGIEVGMEQSHV
jgi:hypothetical protein